MKKNTNLTIRAHLLRGAFYVLLLLAVCVIPFALAKRTVSERTLTFAERVAYQRAIEDVYWRHRIWPKERPDPKPSLDAVMSKAQLEKKVHDYLRKSQALEDYWQRPITTEQLQAEIDRMAHHTKQPDVLRELFAALGDDSFVVAECLARPVLAQRLVTELNNEDRVKLTTIAWLNQPLQSLVAAAHAPIEVAAIDSTPKAFGVQVNRPYTLPAISSPSAGCIDDTWTSTSVTNAPSARDGATAVWTGSEMIVWGGGNDGPPGFNTGGRYNPSTDSWTATSTTNAPEGRFYGQTAVWTGSEMIVWGGLTTCNQGCYATTGGRYSPGTDSWIATSTTNAPEPRDGNTAVWTGSEMIVWGGYGDSGYLNTGGRYNPSTNSWTMTSMTNAPDSRFGHTAVWTGSEMIVWAGYHNDYLNTGGRYNPSTDSWTAISMTNAPSVRYVPTAVWTGSEMIAWGGYGPPCNPNCSALNTGGRYNPSTDSWTATTTNFAPVPRYTHTAVWTSSEMIIWGGLGPNLLLGTGGRYNPSNDSWRATSTTNAPFARFNHTAVWTGSEMIVWGGNVVSTPTARPQLSGQQPRITENTGGRYCAAAPSPTPTPTPTATATPSPTPTPTPSPCIVYIADPHCDSVINTQPVDFSVQLSDPTDPGTVQPTDFMVNGIPADSYIFNPTFIVFHFNTSPVVQGLNVMHIPACAFECHIGCTPEFTCTFTYQPSTPTPTPTATATATPTTSPTATPTATPTPTVRPTPTARPRATPRTRPTPPPRP